MEEVDDHLNTLTALRQSSHSNRMRKNEFPIVTVLYEEIERWEDRMRSLSDVLNRFCEIQQKWIELLPVSEIGAFSEIQSNFQQVDPSVRCILSQIKARLRRSSRLKCGSEGQSCFQAFRNAEFGK